MKAISPLRPSARSATRPLATVPAPDGRTGARHRRRRLHRLPRRRRPPRARRRRAVGRRAAPAAHGGRPDYLHPGAEWVDGDLRDPDVAARCVAGAERGLPPGRDGRPGDRLRRRHRLRRPQRLRHGGAAARPRARAASPAASCWPRAWSSTARAGTRARSTASCGPDRGGRATSTPVASSRPAPSAAPPLEPRAVPEDAPVDPRNVYAATKLAQEHLCAAYGRETGVPVTALRYHNVYGPRMPRDTPYAGVASIFRSSLEAREPPAVFEDGAQRRDFVHVRDVARANVLALTAAEPVAGALNVCSGTPRTVGEMAAALARAAGTGLEPRVTGAWRAGDVRHVFAAPERAAERLGVRGRRGLRGRHARVRHRAAAHAGPARALSRARCGLPHPRTPGIPSEPPARVADHGGHVHRHPFTRRRAGARPRRGARGGRPGDRAGRRRSRGARAAPGLKAGRAA